MAEPIVPERKKLTVWKVRITRDSSWCAFDRREDADLEVEALRREGYEPILTQSEMDPAAYERLPEFDGY